MERQRWKVKVGEECQADHSTVWERFKRSLYREKSVEERVAYNKYVLPAILGFYAIIFAATIVLVGMVYTAPVTVEGSCAASDWHELPEGLVMDQFDGRLQMYPNDAECTFKVSGPAIVLAGLSP